MEYLVGIIVLTAATFLNLRIYQRSRNHFAIEKTKLTQETVSEVSLVVDWKAALDALPLGVVTVAQDGVEEFRNQTAISTTGIRHADVLIDAAVKRMIGLSLMGLDSQEQVQLAGPPQRVFVVRALPLGQGGAIAMIEDITERWILDQVRTDFVANVSHELKTPVGAMSVLAETLEGESDDPLVLRLVNRIIIESERMSHTIDDLLELSRIEMGGEVVNTEVNLNEVVREAIERAAPVALRNGIAIDFDPSDPPAILMGDFFQLVSAVGNLVDNAVKYGESDGGVQVRVIPEGQSVKIEVQDHGIGIPAASLERIFERFYRVDRARSRGTGGTGLGLSIVRHVATNHGGEVNVRSREGEGSTFSLLLPLVSVAPSGTMGTNDECR